MGISVEVLMSDLRMAVAQSKYRRANNLQRLVESVGISVEVLMSDLRMAIEQSKYGRANNLQR